MFNQDEQNGRKDGVREFPISEPKTDNIAVDRH